MTEIFLVPFGKYKNKTLRYIYENDEQYLRWMLETFEIQNSPFSVSLTNEINKIFNPKYVPNKKKKIVLFDNTWNDPNCPF